MSDLFELETGEFYLKIILTYFNFDNFLRHLSIHVIFCLRMYIISDEVHLDFVSFAWRPLIVVKSADDIIHQKVVITLVNTGEVK